MSFSSALLLFKFRTAPLLLAGTSKSAAKPRRTLRGRNSLMGVLGDEVSDEVSYVSNGTKITQVKRTSTTESVGRCKDGVLGESRERHEALRPRRVEPAKRWQQ